MIVIFSIAAPCTTEKDAKIMNKTKAATTKATQCIEDYMNSFDNCMKLVENGMKLVENGKKLEYSRKNANKRSAIVK